MPRPLPARPSLSLLKNQAKALRKAFTSGQPDAHLRVQTHHPAHASTPAKDLALRDAQLVIAREYGFENWTALKTTVETEAQKTDAQTLKANRIKIGTSSPEDIAQIVQKACGSPPAQTDRITTQFSNEIHLVTTQDGQRVVYRANWYCQQPHFETERWALDQCAQIGLPTPKMRHLEHNLPGHPKRSTCVLTFIEGRPLSDLLADHAITNAEYHDLLRQTGALYGKLHTIRTRGFNPHNAHIQEDHPNWQSAYTIDHERLMQSAHNADLPETCITEALTLLDANTSLGNTVVPVLLHGDFQLAHIMIHEGTISGLIDFEYCKSGDPASELDWGAKTLTSWWSSFTEKSDPTIPTAPIIEGYHQTATIDNTFFKRAEWYHLWRSLNGLAYHGINDRNTAGMMPFLNHRIKQDLDRARKRLT